MVGLDYDGSVLGRKSWKVRIVLFIRKNVLLIVMRGWY